MDYEQALGKAKELVTAANEIVIVTHANPNMDSMGGSLALCLGLISLGKKATVICPDPVTVGLSSFVGVDRVSKEFGKKNFVISLDYDDGSIEKVSYNIEGKKFNLVVEHRPGYEPFTADKAHYSYQGVGADLILSVDTQNFAQLGSVYEANKDLFAGKSIINIDFHNENVNYGAINLVDPGASSSAELVAEFLATLGVKLTTDIATNLLNAIYAATDNFRNANVTSMAFEVASVCVKAGAKRFGVAQASVAPAATQTADVIVKEPVMEAPQTVVPMEQPAVAPVVVPAESPKVEPVVAPVEAKPADPHAPPPAEWLKPKIFKSSNLA
jgi:nanoRNase/pAp phosphatase (c-di-AMP/oligoRNAs hydrolase)